MASGRFDLYETNPYQWAWVVYEENSSSITNNTSNVTVWVYFRRSNNDYTSSGTMNTTVTVGGDTKTESLRFSNSGTEDTLVFAKVFENIPHNANGSKTVNIAVSTVSNSGFSASGSIDVALDTIARHATITSAPDFNDEENPTITYSNPAGDVVSSLLACISLTGERDDIPYRDISKTGTSYTFELTDAERDTLRNATTTSNSRTVLFIVWSDIGGVASSSWFTRTLKIVNGNPVFTEDKISYTDTDESVIAITNEPTHIVQNQSNLKVTFESATPQKASSISRYDITVNGVTKSVTESGTVDFGKINTTSNCEIIITATDSRGNATTARKTATILAWSPPIFTVNLERLNNYEDETYLTVDASVSSVNSKNTMAISYLFKESGGEYIGEPIPIENKTTITEQCDKNKAYIFSITVEDAFDSTSNEFALSKGKFPLFIDTEKNAVGINDFPTEGEALRVADGVARFTDGIVLCGATKTFLITVNDNGTLNITEKQ